MSNIKHTLNKSRNFLSNKKYYQPLYSREDKHLKRTKDSRQYTQETGSVKKASNLTLKTILVLFLIAVIVKLPYALFLSLPYQDDAMEYMNSSINLAQTGFYSIDGVNPNVKRAFTYPLILTASHLIFGVSMKIPIYINLLMSAASAVLLFVLANNLFNKKTAYLSYILMLIVPGINLSIPVFLSENSAIFFLILLIFLLFYNMFENNKTGKQKMNAKFYLTSILTGVVLLLLIYSRSAFVFAIPPLILMAILTKDSALRKKTFIAILVAFLIMNLWALRNHSWTGNYSYFGSEGAINVYIGFRTEFDGLWTGWPEKLENGVYWGKDKTLLNIIENYPPNQWNEQYINETLNEIKSKPLAAIGLCAKNFGRTWFPPYAYNFLVKDYVNNTGYDFASIRLWTTIAANFYFVFWTLLLALAILGILISRYSELEIFTITLLAVSAFIFTFLGPIPRYHISLLPIIFLFAANGLVYAYYELFKKYYL